jgi:hypothetical protein
MRMQRMTILTIPVFALAACLQQDVQQEPQNSGEVISDACGASQYQGLVGVSGCNPAPVPPPFVRANLCETESLRNDVGCTFAEAIIDGVTEGNGGFLVHGVEPSLVLATFLGILPKDFDGVPVSQGIMRWSRSEIAFVPRQGEPLTSAPTTLIMESYQSLFRNVKARTGLMPVTPEQAYYFALDLK